jgi:hypothetical protein
MGVSGPTWLANTTGTPTARVQDRQLGHPPLLVGDVLVGDWPACFGRGRPDRPVGHVTAAEQLRQHDEGGALRGGLLDQRLRVRPVDPWLARFGPDLDSSQLDHRPAFAAGHCVPRLPRPSSAERDRRRTLLLLPSLVVEVPVVPPSPGWRRSLRAGVPVIQRASSTAPSDRATHKNHGPPLAPLISQITKTHKLTASQDPQAARHAGENLPGPASMVWDGRRRVSGGPAAERSRCEPGA